MNRKTIIEKISGHIFGVLKVSLFPGILFFGFIQCFPQFTQPPHRIPGPGEIAVNTPGNYGEEGKTYILVNDISSAMSTVFLGKDITLDLNGYTISFADGNYGHIPNYSFENGLEGWDVSRAPSAVIGDTRMQVIVGDKVLRLKAGEEIVSGFIDLPLQDRSYFAICGVAEMDMKVSIFVEDSNGSSVNCLTKYGAEEKVSCPAIDLNPRLGGGIVYAHLMGLPAGKYRLRIKAVTDCIIDYADLRPALDVGIAIVEKVKPAVNYTHLYNENRGAFFDYRYGDKGTEPIPGIPVARGKGTVTIKNGTIQNKSEGILSYGIQSTADSIMVVLENVRITNSGINSNAVDVPQAVITKCTFDVNNPFIISRHGSDNYSVDLWGKSSSEVSFCEFYGGQGCLVFKGDFSKIHHNFFANRQTITNHYSILAMGDSSMIFQNKIIPETGSGIEIYVHRGIEIFNNEIAVEAAPPTCEYGHTDFSTTAIRIADYNAIPGSLNSSYGNKVYNNRIKVTGKDFPYYEDYIPMAWAVFYSSSGGDNSFFGNEITINDLTPDLKNETAGFYIGGGSIGGSFFNNHITANVPAFWVASRYGSADDIKISGNTITKSPDAPGSYKPVRMGWDQYKAKNIQFRSNIIEGSGFEIDKTNLNHSYSVFWTLVIRLMDKNKIPVAGTEIYILDAEGAEVFRQSTGNEGILKAELPEYSINGPASTNRSPYTVIAGKKRMKVFLTDNQELDIEY